MKRILAFSCIGMLSIGKICAIPTSVDVGTFTIENYSANGGGGTNLTYMNAAGANFFQATQTVLSGYSQYAGMKIPTLVLNPHDTQVTRAAITSTYAGSGGREFCNFIYYGGHGQNGALFLGGPPNSSGTYGTIPPSSLLFGWGGYNRWFLANSCSAFNTAPSAPAVAWKGAFRGLKAMLGFKSHVFDIDLSSQLYTDFWYNWTSREESLSRSFFDAESDYGYRNLFPTYGLEPGCLSAQVTNGITTDYCKELFKNTNLTVGNYTSGNYYSQILGSPQY
jgi:Family of unknown function (DUF6345)